jgi:hypothetical protein
LCFILTQPHILALLVFAKAKFHRLKNQKS